MSVEQDGADHAIPYKHHTLGSALALHPNAVPTYITQPHRDGLGDPGAGFPEHGEKEAVSAIPCHMDESVNLLRREVMGKSSAKIARDVGAGIARL